MTLGHVVVGFELAAAVLFVWSALLHRRARRRLEGTLRELENFRVEGRARVDALLAAVPQACPGCGLPFQRPEPSARA